MIFTNGHASGIEVHWGAYSIGGASTSLGSFALDAAGSETMDMPAGESFNIWYLEGDAVSYLGSTGTPTSFNLAEGSEYTLSFNANKTYSFALVIETPATAKRLYAAFLMHNANAVPIDISADWSMEFLDSTGDALYVKTDFLSPTSTVPYIYTNGSSYVFPFSAPAGADFYLSGLSSYTYIAIGEADTDFTPDQIATVRLSAIMKMNEDSNPSTAFLGPSDMLEYAGCSVAGTYAVASIRNNAPSLAFNTTLTRILALDSSGKYIGLSGSYNDSDAEAASEAR